MNKLKNILFVFIATLLFVGCDESKPELYDGPDLATFINADVTIYALEGSSAIDTIKVGVNVISQVERRVGIEVVNKGDAQDGVHYTIATEAIFPANSSIGYITIKGNYENLASDGPQDITITLKEADGIKIAGYSNVFECRLSQYCPLIISELAGDYEVVYEWWFEDALIHDAVVTVVDDVTIKIVTGGLDFDVVLDDTDPANFMATVAPQEQWVYGGTHPVFIQGTGSFSACDNTISLSVQHAMPSYPYAWGFDACNLVKK